MKSDKITDSMEFLPDEMLDATDRIRQKKTIKWWKPLTAVAACLVLLFGAMLIFAATGATSSDKATEEVGMAAPMENAMFSDGSAGSTAVAKPQPTNQKLVRTVSMEAETEELEPLLAGVEAKLSELEGYVELREVYNGGKNAKRRIRRVEMTLRIPADKLDAFVDYAQDSAHIVSTNETVENITLTYVATESRVNALKAEEERLLELMKQAKNMSDLLQIEKRLTEVRAELEQVTSQLLIYDNMVDYGTLKLTVSEVKEYTEVEEPETVWERITSGLKNSFASLGTFFTELFVFIVVALPYLAIIAVVLTVTVIFIRRRKRKK